VSKSWERIKAEERAAEAARTGAVTKTRKGTLDGIPRALPALVRALRTGEKAAGVGFDWQRPEDVRAKVREEWDELDEALKQRDAKKTHAPSKISPSNAHNDTTQTDSPEDAHVAEELGDLLFSLANLARHLKIDPEDALRRTLDKFQRRFSHLEQALEKAGRTPSEATLDELERLWEDAKLFDRQ
jgi:ATP diphosphatase